MPFSAISLDQGEDYAQSYSQSSFSSHAYSKSSSKLLSRSVPSLSESQSSLSSTRSLGSMTIRESRGRPYMNTMKCRRHIRPLGVSPIPSRKVRNEIRQGSLYQQLLAKGVTEEVAYSRQQMFYRLNDIVSTCDNQDL